jgi:hypothetical protein
MSAVPNHALRQLRAGKLAIGLGVRNARTVDIGQIARTCGFDWLFIDGEHSSMDLDMAAQIAAASLAVGISPIVRVAGFEHWHASRILDNGAQGIVFPHVDSAQEAKRVADACRFPPAGKRSMGGGLQQTGFASMPASTSREDGLTLHDLYITAAAHCAPPGNKPEPGELRNCRPYLERELELLTEVKVVVALGKIAFDVYLDILKARGVIVSDG